MRRPYRKMNLDERRILAQMLQAKATKTDVASLVECKTRFAVLFRNNDRSTTHLMNRLMG